MSINNILNIIANSINLTPQELQEAQSKQLGLSSYLSNQSFKTDVYIQGSFSYGTAVKPLKKDKDGDFDLDIVCEVKHNFENPKSLKNWIGDILKKSVYKEYLIEEGKRCWTLEYENFHIDLLPAIADTSKGLTFIKITNKNKKTQEYSFVSSNPKGLTRWFLEINNNYFISSKSNMKSVLFYKNRKFFEESMKYRTFNDIEDRFLSTSLQNTIKLLKRHRDHMFTNTQEEDYKPISVIITVLCALTLQNSKIKLIDLIDVIENFTRNFDKHIQQSQTGWKILNPVDSLENLADRWKEDNGIRASMFYKWIESVNLFLKELNESDDNTILATIEKYLGSDVAQKSSIPLNEMKQNPVREIVNPTSKPWKNNVIYRRRDK